MAYIKVLAFFLFLTFLIFVPPLFYFYESESVPLPVVPLVKDVGNSADGSLTPPNTSILGRLSSVNAPCSISLRSDSDYMYYVNIYNDSTNLIVATVFLRPGTDIVVPVDDGFYKIKFSVGERWYGLSGLFGRNAEYYVSEKTIALLSKQPHNNYKTVVLSRQINKDFPFIKTDKKSF